MVDQNNRISQVQLAPDLTAIPDIKVAIEEAKLRNGLVPRSVPGRIVINRNGKISHIKRASEFAHIVI